MSSHYFQTKSISMKVCNDKILPPDIVLRILVVAAPTFGFLVLALTALPKNGDATLTTGFKNLFHAA